MKYIIITLFLFLVSPVKADYIIYLKNGNESKIKEYKIKDDEICFEMFGGEICFSKTEILKIIETDENAVLDNNKSEINLSDKVEIINTGTDAKNNIADSYAEKAYQFYMANKFDDALRMLSKAMENDPGRLIFPKNAGIICYNTGNYEKAREMFIRVLELDKNDIFAHEYLGRSYYYSNLLEKALPELKTAALFDTGNSPLHAFLEKAEKENKIENSFRKTSQEVFLIQYDSQNESRFSNMILKTLLEAYWDIIRDFSFYSKKDFKIPVIIYTSESFKDIEHPEWASATYDGKIRIPVGNINEQKEKDLGNFIYHELAHAILYYYCNGRTIPGWLNEGIAQLEEKNGKNIGLAKRSLREKQLIPLKNMEKGFSNLTNSNTVNLVYTQSYLAASFIIERYSRQALLDILKYLSEDRSIEDAILNVLFIDFAQFEKKYNKYILEQR